MLILDKHILQTLNHRKIRNKTLNEMEGMNCFLRIY